MLQEGAGYILGKGRSVRAKSITIKDYFNTDRNIPTKIISYDDFNDGGNNGIYGMFRKSSVTILGDGDTGDYNGDSDKDWVITGNGSKTINTGAGNDKIQVGWNHDLNIYGNQIVNAGSGDDYIVVNDIIQDDREDVIYGTVIDTKNHDLKVVVNGDEGNDWIDVQASGVELNGGTGNDYIVAGGGTGNIITGDRGKDSISCTSEDSKIYGGNGDDDILLACGNNNVVYGEEGNDSILVHDVYDCIIDGGPGDDYFNVYISYGIEPHSITLSGGYGTDNYYIGFASLPNDANIIINQDKYNFGDEDYLMLGFNSQDMQFGLQEDTLTITPYNGGKISVTNWKNNPLNEIIFNGDMVSLSYSDINEIVGIY